MAIELISQKYKEDYKIYTDGSKIEGKTGYGIYDSKEKTSYSGRLKTQYTIMNAEIFAILKAVEYLKTKNIKTAVILTDSKSAAQLINNNATNDNFLVAKLKKDIHESQIERITIQWVPGHSGLVGNERADLAAKLGTNRQYVENTQLTKDDLILNLKIETKCYWNQRYKTISEEKGIYHYQIAQDVNQRPWFSEIRLPTQHTITINRLRTGHLATKDRLKNWGLITNDNCEHCNLKEDIIHILHHCPKFDTIRNKYPVLINREDLIIVLAGTNIQKIKHIAQFIGETKINV